MVGSYQGCSEALHSLAREAAKAKTAKWRQMRGRTERARGAGDLHARRTCTAAGVAVFWRSWARVIRGRLPVIGRPNADILNHGPPPAHAHGRDAVGCWLGRGVAACTSCVGHAHGDTYDGSPVSGARRAGGYRLSRPCSG